MLNLPQCLPYLTYVAYNLNFRLGILCLYTLHLIWKLELARVINITYLEWKFLMDFTKTQFFTTWELIINLGTNQIEPFLNMKHFLIHTQHWFQPITQIVILR
jgi:hypothetical protein